MLSFFQLNMKNKYRSVGLIAYALMATLLAACAVPEQHKPFLITPAALPTTTAATSLQDQGIESSFNPPFAAETRFDCELANSFVVLRDEKQPNAITLRWQNKNYALQKVETQTGAERFEDRSSKLVWINIPSKSLLLDGKNGRQLANDCKSDYQRKHQSSNSSLLH